MGLSPLKIFLKIGISGKNLPIRGQFLQHYSYKIWHKGANPRSATACQFHQNIGIEMWAMAQFSRFNSDHFLLVSK